jgi:putative ABC transport system permease protein
VTPAFDPIGAAVTGRRSAPLPAFRRVASPTADALRAFGRSSALAGAAAALALAAVLPVRLLSAPSPATATRLGLVPSPAPADAVGWTSLVRPPDGARTAALGDLFLLLVVVACAVAIVGAVGILTQALARAGERAHEIAVRRAVGASRRDVLLASLLESAVVALGMLALALPAAAAAVTVMARRWDGPLVGPPPSAWPLVLAALGILALAAVLPLGHPNARRLQGVEPGGVSLWVPTLQTAAAVVVLTTGVLLQRLGESLTAAPEPTRAEGTPAVVFQVDSGLHDAAARWPRYRALLARLRAEPTVATAAIGSPGTAVGLGTVDVAMTHCGQCARSNIIMQWLDLRATYHLVGPGALEARGVRRYGGRDFTAYDVRGARRVAIVNRHLAERYFERGEAVGRELYLTSSWPRDPYEVVGVVDDERPSALGGRIQPRETIYLSILQHPPRITEVVVRSAEAVPHVGRVAELVRSALGGSARVLRTETEHAERRRAASPFRWFGSVLLALGGVTLLLAVGGTMQAVRQWVRASARELALRRAVGASRVRAAWFVATRVGGAVLGGVGIGAALFALWLWAPLSRIVTGLPPGDARLLGVVVSVLSFAAAIGATGPARRVLREPPASHLH